MDSRIEVILSLIQDLASGELQARRERSERSDELDAVIAGLNHARRGACREDSIGVAI